MRSLAGDARCQLVLPTDGEYRIELHDALFRGAEPSHFRLSVGDLDYADFVFPLGVQRNSRVNVDLVGTNLPPDHAQVEFSAGPFAGTQPAPWPALASVGVASSGGALHLSGGRPVVLVSDYAELAENPAAAGLNELSAAPVGVSGRLLKPGETDAYRLPVTAGQQLRFEVQAIGSGPPSTPYLAWGMNRGANSPPTMIGRGQKIRASITKFRPARRR